MVDAFGFMRSMHKQIKLNDIQNLGNLKVVGKDCYKKES